MSNQHLSTLRLRLRPSALQHAASLRSAACQQVSKSSHGLATGVEPDRLSSGPSCAVGRSRNQKAEMLTSDSLRLERAD